MEMTDGQFKQFLDGVTQNQKHWEMLIRIDENTKNMNSSIQKHFIDDVSEFSIHKASLSKVHERIDVFKESFQKEIQTVDDKISTVDESVKSIKNKVVGAAVIMTVLLSSLQIGLSIYNSTKDIRIVRENSFRTP